MKKTNGKKLALNLETIAPLVLDDVNGGQAATTQTVSKLVCTRIACVPSLRIVCAGDK